MWQPIETAPKGVDAPEILVCCAIDSDGKAIDQKSFGLFVQRASWWGDRWIVYCSMIQDPELFFEPTHWMPIPDSPLTPGSGLTSPLPDT